MGTTRGQRRAQELRGKKTKKRKRRGKPEDPRFKAIISKAGIVKITRPDGSIEFQEPLKPTKIKDPIYRKPRPRPFG